LRFFPLLDDLLEPFFGFLVFQLCFIGFGFDLQTLCFCCQWTHQGGD
jgi:hypothetical protein